MAKAYPTRRTSMEVGREPACASNKVCLAGTVRK
jgi:hypothetical protein